MELIGNISHLIFDKVLWNAVFPTTILLLVFVLFNLKAFKLNSQFIFVFITLIVIIFVRLVFGVALGGGKEGGWDVESRRFYMIGAMYILFVVAGFPVLIDFSKKLTDKFYKKKIFTSKKLVVFWIIVFGIIGIGKGLSVPSYKAYVNEPGEIIKANTPKNMKSLFISESGNDWRKRYHSNADKSININTVLNRGKPVYFYDALKTLKEKGYKPYILVNNSNKRFEKIFTDKGIDFKLKLLKQWKDGEYSLYIYDAQ